MTTRMPPPPPPDLPAYIAWERPEHEPCQRGTVGCCINHTGDDANRGCETW